MERKYIALYGGETTEDGQKLGPEVTRRMEGCMRFIKANLNCTIVLGAGIRPDQRNYPQMKDLMYVQFQKEDHIPPRIIRAEKDGWGTFRESVAIKGELPEDVIEIWICSSWYHIPRIKFIWWIIAPHLEINIISVESPQIGSLKTEILSFVKVFWDWYKFKTNRLE